MESSESPDSKNGTTISQASYSRSDPGIAAEPRLDSYNEQKSKCNAPCTSQQALANEIRNVPDDNGVNQQHQQLLNNNIHPQLPINEPMLNNGPGNQLPQLPRRRRRPPLRRRRAGGRSIIRQRIPHFHFTFGNQDWTYNDLSQRIPVRVRLVPAVRNRYRPPVNVCHRLMMNERPSMTVQQWDGEQDQGPSTPPPLISRREIEPGIFEELYSHRQNYFADKPKMLGVDRCIVSIKV